MNLKILDTEPQAIAVEKFFSSEEVVGLLESSKREFEREKANRIIYDGTVCEIKPRALRRLADIDLFRQRIEDFIKQRTEYKVNFRKLWFVNTTHKHADPKKLPYIAHFDKKRYLKFMVYLTDVSPRSGPLTLMKYEGQDIEARRLKLQKNGLGSNILDDKPCGSFVLTAQAGSLVMFDTNTPHLAGFIKPDEHRSVARFDFETDGWNKKTLKENVRDFFGI